MPQTIMLPKMNGTKYMYNETTYMSFLANEEQMLRKYNKIWNKVSYMFNREFSRDLVHNKLKQSFIMV